MNEQQKKQLSTPMDSADIFHFSEESTNFNHLSKTNGFHYWYASVLMKKLGYKSLQTFRKALNRAMTTCTALNIEMPENIVPESRTIDGHIVSDYRLSRFACYLVVMNADPGKPEVARAQVYFAVLAEAFRRYIEEGEEVERVNTREEITDHEKSLGRFAKGAGVVDYALFQNAGYRGLYNMNLNELRKRKGVHTKRTLLDFMGKRELAANLFRLTETEAKLQNEQIKGQHPAENAAESVGRTVRKAMGESDGQRPEDLPIGEDIKKVRSALKSSHKDFKKLDDTNSA